tara:strand:+ start:1900 stop:2358 length:459 start_codon:yes stop_codon:yes gene_type:complete
MYTKSNLGVSLIAKKLDVNPETIRRWLKANNVWKKDLVVKRQDEAKENTELIRDNVEVFTNKQSNPLLNLLSPRTLSKAAENVDEGIQNADPRNPKHSTAIKANIDILKALSGLDRGRDSNGSLNINVSLLKKNWGANQDVVDAEIQEEPEE